MQEPKRVTNRGAYTVYQNWETDGAWTEKDKQLQLVHEILTAVLSQHGFVLMCSSKEHSVVALWHSCTTGFINCHTLCMVDQGFINLPRSVSQSQNWKTDYDLHFAKCALYCHFPCFQSILTCIKDLISMSLFLNFLKSCFSGPVLPR